MSADTLIIALAMGVTGSLHCAGMCGAIVWVMPFQFFQGQRKYLAMGLYHLARISVYAGMALVLYQFRDLFDPKVQQYISVILGSLLLLVGILSFLPAKGRFSLELPWAGYVKKRLGTVIGQPTLGAITAAGALNGLLPCGLVYMALSATLSLPTPAAVVGFVFTFGAGTLPMLVSITLLKSRVSLKFAHVRKFVPVVLFSFGCLFVLRGLNLGIPYLSPKTTMTNHQIHSCCHKN